MEAFIVDSYRRAVEAASGGKNTVIRDKAGNPSVMVVIPKFKLEDIDASLGTGTHPAFIVHGKEVPEIYYPKFQNVVQNGCAVSQPGMDPAVWVNFDQARAYALAKGPGWHLANNAEWAAIALWAWKNGTQPRGNTSSGKSHEATYENGRHGGDGRTLTGSGLRDIANFVSQRLATLEGVLSTRTHFVLKRYKEKGILIQDEPGDERGVYL